MHSLECKSIKFNTKRDKMKDVNTMIVETLTNVTELRKIRAKLESHQIKDEISAILTQASTKLYLSNDKLNDLEIFLNEAIDRTIEDINQFIDHNI